MMEKEKPNRPGFLVTQVIWLSLAVCALGPGLPQGFAAKRPQPAVPSAFPDDVQLVNADTDPTLRIPIAHFTQTTLTGPFSRITGGFGWLEISHSTVRYTAMEQLHVGHYGNATKETDIGFEYARSDLTELKMLYRSGIYPIPDNAVQAHVQNKIRQYFSYYAEGHWPLDRKGMDRMQKVDAEYTPLILRAFQNFDGAVADFKLKHPAAASPLTVAQPAVAPEPEPAPPPPPPMLVIFTPPGASENGTAQVNESPLTIRGVAMDNSGLPTVTINGAPASLRPKDAHAVEFWSDPLPLQPGDNPIQIGATNSAHVEAKVAFTVHYTSKAAPVNPKALDKAEIISLLLGAVPPSRVAEIVKERGIKFVPNTDDLNEIRAAGGTDELNQTIQEAALRK